MVETKKDKIKTLIPYWLIMITMAVITYESWIGPYPSRKIMMLASLFAIAFIYLISLIPFVFKLMQWINQQTKEFLYSIPHHRWGRFFIMVFVDFILALITERIINHSAPFNWRVVVWSFAVYFIPSVLITFRDLVKERIEIIVFLLIMTTGSVFATTLPVSCGICWDDESHFRVALQLSHMFDARMTGGDFIQLNEFPATALSHDRYTLESHNAWIEYIDKADKEDKWVGVGRKMPIPQNLCYLPSAVGLTLGRTLRLPYHLTFILGRYFNLIAYAILIYLSIRKIKTGKMIVATVSMMPPLIFMAASYARDPWAIGFLSYGFCYLIGEIQEPDKLLTLKDILIMLISFVLGVAPKAIYFPIMMVCLFMPQSKFKDKKWHRLYLLLFAAGALLALSSFALPFIASGGGSQEDTRGGNEVSATSQTSYILSNPIGYIILFFRFFADYISQESAGTYLNYMHYFGTADYSILTEIALLVACITDRGEEDRYIHWSVKISTLIASFACIGLAATAMYVAYTPYMYETILGCQYRYMFLIFIPTLFVLGSFRFEDKLLKTFQYPNYIPKGIYRTTLLFIMSFILMNGLWDLCIKGFM